MPKIEMVENVPENRSFLREEEYTSTLSGKQSVLAMRGRCREVEMCSGNRLTYCQGKAVDTLKICSSLQFLKDQ